MNSQNRGLGNKGGRPGVGPGGSCICPKCGTVEQHVRGVPCFTIRCGKCGSAMIRKEKQP